MLGPARYRSRFCNGRVENLLLDRNLLTQAPLKKRLATVLQISGKAMALHISQCGTRALRNIFASSTTVASASLLSMNQAATMRELMGLTPRCLWTCATLEEKSSWRLIFRLLRSKTSERLRSSKFMMRSLGLLKLDNNRPFRQPTRRWLILAPFESAR